ncbi:unnamed protein product, partial [Ectocarpus fasciculatus]
MLLNMETQLSITDDHGYTALHWSALAGHLAVTKMLVEAGAPLEAADISDLSLHAASLCCQERVRSVHSNIAQGWRELQQPSVGWVDTAVYGGAAWER